MTRLLSGAALAAAALAAILFLPLVGLRLLACLVAALAGREYLAIMRDVWARQGPVTADGPHYPLPMPGGTGLGKPLKSSIHPLREEIPVYLAAEGPKNIALGAEICDGWMAMLLSPYDQEPYVEALNEGFAREGARRTAEEFEVAATVPMLVMDDVDAAADALRHYYALYFGGMGAKGKNFHANVPIRMGYADMVERVQDLYLDGKKQEAAEAIPFELIDKMSLIGPKDKIRHDLEAWRESFVTTLLIGGDVATVRVAAELVLG